MESNTLIPFKRDWLTEAVQIAEGSSGMKPKKEHLVALYTAFRGLSGEHAKMQTLLQNVLKEAQKKRAEQGLPNPPVPGRLAAALGQPTLDQSK